MVADRIVSPRGYAHAVAELAAHAYTQTGTGEACARILLSSFDPWQWGFTAADLARLGPDQLEAALTVLRARAQLGPPQYEAASSDTATSAFFLELAGHWRPERPRPAGHSGET